MKGFKAYLTEAVDKELKSILSKNKKDFAAFKKGEEMSDKLYDALYDFYVNNGEMPIGVAKARTGDPYQWIGDRIEKF